MRTWWNVWTESQSIYVYINKIIRVIKMMVKAGSTLYLQNFQNQTKHLKTHLMGPYTTPSLLLVFWKTIHNKATHPQMYKRLFTQTKSTFPVDSVAPQA